MNWTDLPAPDGPWEAKHYPEGSIVQTPDGKSIFVNSAGTPCVSREVAEVIVSAVNALRASGEPN